MRSPAEEIELMSVGSADNAICIHYMNNLRPGTMLFWTSPVDIGDNRIPSSLIVLRFLLDMAPGWFMTNGVRIKASRQVCLPLGIVRLFRMIAEREHKSSGRVVFLNPLEHFYVTKFQATEACEMTHQVETTGSQPPILRSNNFNFALANMIIARVIESISFNRKFVNIQFPDYSFWTVKYKAESYANGWPAHPLFLTNLRLALLDIFSIDLEFNNSLNGQGFGAFDSRSFGLITELTENRELLLSLGAVAASCVQSLESEARESVDSENVRAQHILDTYKSSDEPTRRVLLMDLPVGSEPLLAASIGHCSNCSGVSIDNKDTARLHEGFWTRSGFAVHGIDSQVIPRWGSVLFEA